MSGTEGGQERHCDRLEELICLYLDGELEAETRLKLEKHLQECAPCLKLLESLRQTRSLCRQVEQALAVPPMPEDLKNKLREIFLRALRP